MSLGMHRTTAASNMDQSGRDLWRRIWWCIYYRDHQSSNSMGRPIRTMEDDIDVEDLTDNDFQSDKETADTHPCCGRQEPEHISLVLAMVGLSKIIPNIRACRYATRRQDRVKLSEAACNQLLDDWEIQLPESVKWAAAQENRWATALHIAYKCDHLRY